MMKQKRYIVVDETEMKVLTALDEVRFWKPNFTKISQEIGVSTSTIYDAWKRILKKNEVKISIDVVAKSVVGEKIRSGMEMFNGKGDTDDK